MSYAYSQTITCNVPNKTIVRTYDSRKDYDNKNINKTFLFTPNEGEDKELSMIFDKVKDLDTTDNIKGQSTLSEKDLAVAATKTKELFGEKSIIRRDSSCGLTTIQLENGKIYAFDFEVAGEKPTGITQLMQDISEGNAKYSNWYNAGVLLSAMFQSGGVKIQDEIVVTAENGTTMKEIKQKYNLPDGALKTYVSLARHASGDRDKFQVDGGKVWFSAKAFAENNGLTIDQVKSLFKK